MIINVIEKFDYFERALPPSICDRIDALAFAHSYAESDGVQRLLRERFRLTEEGTDFLADRGSIDITVCKGAPLTEAAEVAQTTLNTICDVVRPTPLIELLATSERGLDLDEPPTTEGIAIYDQLRCELQAFRMDDKFDDEAVIEIVECEF